MPKKGHSEEQIIGALKQYDSGEKVADICRKLGVSQASFYTWKKQYAGMGVQELRELRQLAGREWTAETAGGGLGAGPSDPAGDRLKKAVRPGHKRHTGSERGAPRDW
jgi:putative transposase